MGAKRLYLTCSYPGCCGKHQARGYCKRHYTQLLKTGSVEIIRANPHLPPDQRFWKFANKGNPDECWNWSGQRDKDGYGCFRFSTAKPMRAHRYSFELHGGQPQDGLFVCHKCDNPSCVNPNHLYLGSQSDNMKDRHRAGKTPFRISIETVKAIKASAETGAVLAKRYNISESQVHNIRHGRQRANIEVLS
jgi:hypothetical protein